MSVEETSARTARPRPNCGEPLGGPYCSHCGQADTALDVPLRRVVGELLAELFDADSRVWRTGRTLLLRPGLLTAEYNAGPRARYLPPLRVYMLSSLLFFFVVATARVQLLQVQFTDEEAAAVVSAGPPAATAEDPATQAAGESAAANDLRAEFLRRLARVARDPERLNQFWLRIWAWTMFALLPVFALVLRLFFRGATPWYVRHLVFSLHLHAFAFLIFAVPILVANLLPDDRHRSAAVLSAFGVIFLYGVLATRRVYSVSWGGTLLRLAGVGFVYLLLASIFLLTSAAAAVWFA
ncbi:MAG TPA: DUF3667 domain-containing protein [Longimicrobiales bacterium]